MSATLGKGQAEFLLHLFKTPEYIKNEQDKILTDGTKSEAQYAAELAPKKTGNMARKIYATKKDEFTYQVVADAYYTIYQEYGTYRILAKEFMKDAERRYTPDIISKLNQNVASSIQRGLQV